MNRLANLTIKELRDLLTPATIITVVVFVLMFSIIGSVIGDQSESATKPAKIGIVYDGNVDETITVDGTDFLSVKDLVEQGYAAMYDLDDKDESTPYIKYLLASEGNDEDILDEMDDLSLSYVVAIPSDLQSRIDAGTGRIVFPIYYVFQNSGVFESISSAAASSLVSNMSSILSSALIRNAAPGENPAFLKSPLRTDNDNTFTRINGSTQRGVDPYSISSTMMGQNFLIPIIVMIVIMMVGSVVISSMGSEKENKTLETLLTMPIKRTSVVAGKLFAATIFGLFYGGMFLVGMMFYSNGLAAGISDTVDLESIGLVMTASDWLLLFLLLFMSIFSALGICMILGAFTRNYKMAQTMTMPITVLAIVPMFVFMFSGWNSLPVAGQAVMFAIPFSHPMMAMNNLMFGDMGLVLAGIAYLVLLDAALLLVTVRIYNSDILLTGIGQTRIVRGLRRMFRIGDAKHGDRQGRGDSEGQE